MTPIQSFRRIVAVDWPKQAAADAKERLLQVARQGHADIMARQGNPQFDAYANRPGNRALETVILPGPIIYTYSNLKALVEFALDELRKTSPVISGDYVRSHQLFVNGAAVDALPADLKPSDELMIANLVPYARKIEVGKTKSGRAFVIQVQPRIYERVGKALQARYKNVARITVEFVTIPNNYRLKADQKKRSWLANKGRWHTSSRQYADRAAGSVVTAPAIVIAPLV
ncbi:MAG: hypothetical protein WC026_16505 [Hyphomicrobium sp.]|uniref:hypothetical protein n=1 Tax=Hyphomicrobium sp. TaxID=82 RepID=UPI00356488E2